MENLIIMFSLLIIGYGVGQLLEKQHFKSIEEREKKLLKLVTTTSKKPIGILPAIKHVELVQGNAVICVDYFKRFLALLRGLVGGNVNSYESLLERARREAILRLKASCHDATQVINLRIETSSIYKGNGKQIGSVEVMAYATAIYCNPLL